MGLDKKQRAVERSIKETRKRETKRRSKQQFRNQIDRGDYDDVVVEERIETGKPKWQ